MRNDKSQEVIKAKKEATQMWETARWQDDKHRYRQANKAAQKAVATAKPQVMNELYTRSWKHRRVKERYVGWLMPDTRRRRISPRSNRSRTNKMWF